MPITLEQIFGKPAVQENLRESETCYILREPERLPFPIGWFHLQTRSGLDAGVGFFCPDCKLSVTPAPSRVYHCGATEEQPSEDRITMTHRMGSFQTYRTDYRNLPLEQPTVKPPSLFVLVRDWLRL